MISLLWWEHEHLIDHLKERKDIWTSSRENMWLRTTSYDDDTACLGLVIQPPLNPGPFRQFGISVIPMGWSVTDCDTYLTALCEKWTAYGQRKRYTSFLTEQLGIDGNKANAVAIGLVHSDLGCEDKPDHELTTLPTNRELWPDLRFTGFTSVEHLHTVRSYGLTGGGWVTLRLQGGMLRVRLSVPSDGKYGGGYSSPFEGFIRPADGNIELASVMLFGNDAVAPPYEESVEDGNTGNLLAETPGVDEADPPQPVPGSDVPQLP